MSRYIDTDTVMKICILIMLICIIISNHYFKKIDRLNQKEKVMSRWVNIDTLKANCDIIVGSTTIGRRDYVMFHEIDNAPSIEIIRCKECKYWEQKNPNSAHGWCETFNMFFTPIFFCGYGEEEDNETNY